MSGLPRSLVLVGAGRMGGALLGGWLKRGLDAAAISVLDPRAPTEIAETCRARRIRLNPAPGDVAAPEALVLAVKPQFLEDAAVLVNRLVGPQTLLVSILAGKTIADLRAQIPSTRAIVRAMPNTPAAIGRGITGAVASHEVTSLQHALAQALLSAAGAVEWLPDEALIDAVTAVSGSGPAYVFYLTECMAAAGAAAGLPVDVAERLARATVEGAGALMDGSPALSPRELRENVTSPGGTTAAALDVLTAPPGLGGLIGRAVAAAKQRAAELSG